MREAGKAGWTPIRSDHARVFEAILVRHQTRRGQAESKGAAQGMAADVEVLAPTAAHGAPQGGLQLRILLDAFEKSAVEEPTRLQAGAGGGGEG